MTKSRHPEISFLIIEKTDWTSARIRQPDEE